jgi:murein DD-endopeptidase MepM/ murein hydrolase activator NlpD
MARSRGRHRKPPNRPVAKAAQRVATVGTTTLVLGTAGVTSATSAAAVPDDTWNQLATCESGGDWAAATGNGFFGGLQFLQDTWVRAGGEKFAARADLATPEQQKQIAEEWFSRVVAESGSVYDSWATQWPACSAALNIRDVPPETYNVPAPPPAPDPPAEPVASDADTVYTVAPGDTVSEIAIDIFHLDGWTQFYEDNKSVIGDNPDLILPGQQLIVKMTALPPVPDAPAAPVAPAAPIGSAVSAQGVANPCPSCSVTQEFTAGAHNGIDLDQSIGAPVYAAASGTVTVAGPHDPGGFGQAVYITGDDGTIFWYGHIDTWTVNAGDHVSAGEQIATVGNRGDVVAGPGGDGSHLHFEVHIGPGPVNPRTWLADHGVVL